MMPAVVFPMAKKLAFLKELVSTQRGLHAVGDSLESPCAEQDKEVDFCYDACYQPFPVGRLRCLPLPNACVNKEPLFGDGSLCLWGWL
jgi:hypothetical protein